jgi:hypothetical protein
MAISPSTPAAGQIAAWVNGTAPELTHVKRFPARMFAGNRTSASTNAAHEQHARAVIGFQIVDIGLKTCGISDANASTCTCLARNDDASRVAVGVERGRLMLRGRYRPFNSGPAPASARYRHCCAESRAVAVIVADGRRRIIFAMTLHSFCRQYDECTDGGKCGDFHALL